MVRLVSALIQHLLQSLVDRRRARGHGQGVDAVDFEAALDGGENLVVVHVVSLLAVIL